ncbi:MAG: hypothetical protein PVI30_07000 [Myxococcales bacterium]|jgi:hypothetical protein
MGLPILQLTCHQKWRADRHDLSDSKASGPETTRTTRAPRALERAHPDAHRTAADIVHHASASVPDSYDPKVFERTVSDLAQSQFRTPMMRGFC